MRFFFLFLFCSELYAQNLVLNPSFEDYKNCPESIGYISLKEGGNGVNHWLRPTGGTPDYFNECSQIVGYKNFNGYQKARTGKGYAGFYGFAHGNYREYIQGTLANTLEKDSTYQISFYVSLAELSNRAIKHFGVYFLDHKLSNINYDRAINARRIAEKSSNVGYRPIFNKEYVNNKTQWVEITTTYKAKGFETYFLIGNFESNLNADVEKLESNELKPMGYYYIDDVEIKPLHLKPIKQIEKPAKQSSVSFEEQTVYTLKNVLFEFDKSILLPNSKDELNALYDHLKKHPNLSVEIYGHTDDVGTSERNQELSEQRAKAVADYLTQKGLDSQRIKWFGFGSSKPKASNKTDAGREQNRRVEFKLIAS
ncbi:OmpA family protein [Mangrovimonas sp. AS39]|uniref:OmpA family protein n=1 Tax=Mangrovimonas futianensis TaxID=2895523 RepID=UPI001E32E39A|nr:OmpA family protein [Mangrovimonas futianensis]MCF1190446.1 OmpA family protein [Mangrovimonas futianensis]MCF1193802.1 OmpA family protein [Mangrovimonas futianensis]